MTTGRQDRDFLESVIPNTLLEQAIEWIADNLDPEDVFDKKQLNYWADEQGYTWE